MRRYLSGHSLSRVVAWGFGFVLPTLLSSCNYHEFKNASEQNGDVFVGTGTSGQPTAESRATYAWIRTNILEPKCLVCHGVDNPPGGVDLRSRDTIVQTAGVVSGDPRNSTLFEVVDTEYMPFRRTPLTTDEKNAIFDWIDKGALP